MLTPNDVLLTPTEINRIEGSIEPEWDVWVAIALEAQQKLLRVQNEPCDDTSHNNLEGCPRTMCDECSDEISTIVNGKKMKILIWGEAKEGKTYLQRLA